MPPKLRFGVGPVFPGKKGADRLRLFGHALEFAVGCPVAVRSAPSYIDLLDALETSKLHAAWLPPALFLMARARFDARLLAACGRTVVGGYLSAFFVRADSAARTATALKDRVVGWVDQTSCSGYLFPRLALAEAGFDADTHFSSEYVLGSHAGVVTAVAAGHVDVGATYVNPDPADLDPTDPLTAGWTDAGLDRSDMRVVLLSRAIPSDVICGAEDLDSAMLQRLAQGLLHVHETAEGAEGLRLMMNAVRLEAAKLSDYDPVQAAMSLAQGRVRLSTPPRSR